jgi:hypothetical protein
VISGDISHRGRKVLCLILWDSCRGGRNID